MCVDGCPQPASIKVMQRPHPIVVVTRYLTLGRLVVQRSSSSSSSYSSSVGRAATRFITWQQLLSSSCVQTEGGVVSEDRERPFRGVVSEDGERP